MRKSVILIVCTLICLLTFPVQFSAQASDSNSNGSTSNKKDTGQYNELGIKKGTIVNGIDISKLTKDQLQYIPKNWRDGIDEGEDVHGDTGTEPEQKQERHARLLKSYPHVNSYIAAKNLPEAKVTKDYKDFPKFGYRYNRPEGVVAHETANSSSTIWGEINYMTRNYNNAFVHAFVDDSHVIELHPTNYGAWGAGYYANQRFIHVELVRVHSFDAFARSINNYANYIAELLNQYNLGVSAAKSNGSGTLWSHKDVSYYLGGTTHIDPIGYFNQWGYSWNDFVSLVTKKYNSLLEYKKTSRLGQLESENTRIYSDMNDLSSYKKAGSAHVNRAYFIKKLAKKGGQTYYLISDQPSSTKGTIGWVNSKEIKTYAHTSVDDDAKTRILSGTGVAYNRAWGGKENLVFSSLKNYRGAFFAVNKTEKVGNNTWYRGILDGKQVWIHEHHFSGTTPVTYADVPADMSHYQNIYELTVKGVIKGYSSGNKHLYKPGDDVSRSHAAVIFTNALDLPIPRDEGEVLKRYTDIDSSHTYAGQIAATSKAGIFHGSNGKFMDGPLKREQMATVLVKAFDLKDTGKTPGVKLSNVSPDHRRSVKILAQHGITVELNDFRPFETVTRGQFATFVSKSMQAAK